MSLGTFSYLSAGFAFALFAILLLTKWRGGYRDGLLAITVLISAVWAVLASQVMNGESYRSYAYETFEILRYAAWYIFLLKLFDPAVSKYPGYRKIRDRSLLLSLVFALLLLTIELFSDQLARLVAVPNLVSSQLIGHIFLSMIGLAIIEQLFRNTSTQHRWAVKYLFVGVGGIFAYDFYLYSCALLFRGIDPGLWDARGFVNLIVVPMLALSAVRNKGWSLNLFVSRDVAFTTTAFVAAGLYLMVMAAAGYYLREFGHGWGRVAQAVFFSLALVLLVVVLFSGMFRARLRVFIGKHFYSNKYDYRREWLQLTRNLNERSDGSSAYEAVIRIFARMVDVRTGSVWMREGDEGFQNVAVWNTARIDVPEPPDSSLIRFLETKGYIINLYELTDCADEYEGLEVPAWLSSINRAWLIVPLNGLDSVMGFVVLANPLVSRTINWEDRDLLKTAAKQISSHLTVLKTSDQLTQARQFEVFNRLSAYMVHDLKNIAAELELIGRNADKHRDNPEFLEDTFATVKHASKDIQRLLDQLRNRHAGTEKKVVVDLCSLIRDVIGKKADSRPLPSLETECSDYQTVAEKDRLANVLAHLLDNARQATDENGYVKIRVSAGDSVNIIEIMDNGHGMDMEFIRMRLFRPFDTTKGNAGMGIGMYESREFVRQMGGDIRVDSEPGKGTIIALQLPSNALQKECSGA